MAKQKILLGEWLPDQPGVTGSVTEATNCYPFKVSRTYLIMLALIYC